MLIMQEDVRLVTSLSVIVASLVDIYHDDEMSLYHIFLARALADISLTVHAAATIHTYPAGTIGSYECLSSLFSMFCGNGGAC